MKSILGILEKYATTKNVVAGILLIVVFNSILFSKFSELLSDTEITEKSILDLKFFYTTAVAYTFFEALGEEGRNTYKLAEIFIDFPYALIYGFTYGFIILMLLKINQLKKLFYLSLVPFLISWFDILENSGIVAMLVKYPTKLETICNFTATFTALKWVFAVITLLIIVINLIYLIISTLFLKYK